MAVSAAREALRRLGLLSTEWPDWAVDTFVSLSFCCMLMVITQWLYKRRSLVVSKADGSNPGARSGHDGMQSAADRTMAARFRRFQNLYLVVYLTVMLADWLQGTNMYTLYQSYGVNVGTLFLTGFSSAAVFGTFLGLFVDRFGRRNGCIVFCLLEVVINTLEHVPNMPLLLLGRVLGGISTSLLFSAFESWMVSEHRRRGFPEQWLESTFSAATVGNGIMAVLAGVVAQVASDQLGDIGPFQVAIALTLLALSLLFLWEENYGYGYAKGEGVDEGDLRAKISFPAACDANGNGRAHAGAGETNGCDSRNGGGPSDIASIGSGGAGEGAKAGACGHAPGLAKSVSLAWTCIMSDHCVLLLGLVQSLFEGATFTFVFIWVPTLQGVVPSGVLPTGLVFSCFMVCITIGGAVCSMMLQVMTAELVSVVVFLIAAASMALPAITRDFATVFSSFLVLETCVGAFFSCSGLMRSRYLPGDLQSSIMNIFRLPLNVLVVVGTRLTGMAQAETVFMVIASWFFVSAILQMKLSASSSRLRKAEAGGPKQA